MMTLCDSSGILQARGEESTQGNTTMVTPEKARARALTQGSGRYCRESSSSCGRKHIYILNFHFQWWWWSCTFYSWLERLKCQHVFEISVCALTENMTAVTEMHYSWFMNSKLTCTRLSLFPISWGTLCSGNYLDELWPQGHSRFLIGW